MEEDGDFSFAFGLAGKYRISLGNLTTCKYLIIPIIHLTSNIKKGQFCPIFHTLIIFLLLKNLIINNIYIPNSLHSTLLLLILIK